MGTDRATILARRVPHEAVVLGRAYIIHARNGGVGVAVRDDQGMLGYRLHREKFGRHFLFTEIDWANHEAHGTAIPCASCPISLRRTTRPCSRGSPTAQRSTVMSSRRRGARFSGPWEI